MSEHEQMVEDCEAHEEKLTTWEREFLDTCSFRLARDQGLTEPMADILEKIWERVT